MKRLGMLPRT